MKKFKKLIALTCVAAMLVPSIAFADQTEPSAVTGGGNSVVENNNAQDIQYTSVVVPTVTSSTYDFTIDRDKLIPGFDSQNIYDGNGTVYFSAENTPASIALKAAPEKTTYTLMKGGKRVDIVKGTETISTGALYDILNGKTIAEVATALQGQFFVWVPSKTGEAYNGKGEWVEIVFATYTPVGGTEKTPNYTTYLDITVVPETNKVSAIKLAADPLSGANPWDGNIYTLSFAEITGVNAVKEYGIKYESAAFSKINEGLFVKVVVTEPASTTYVPLTTANAATYVDYTAATQKYTDTSAEATVVNKSTSPIAVSVDVTVTAPGLTFSQTGVYHTNATGTQGENGYVAAWDDTAASVYFTVNAGSNKATVGTDGKATAYYVLDKASVTPITFRGEDSDKNEATGSNNYYNYESPVLMDPVYDSQSFTISASANDKAASNDAWEKYIADLNDGEKTEVVKPTISVVYNWVVLGEAEVTENTDNPATEDVETNVTIKTYKDAEENAYVTLAANGWVLLAGETVEPTEAYGYFSPDRYKVWLNLEDPIEGEILEVSKVKDVKVAQADGEAVTVDFSVEEDWILVKWEDMEEAGCTWVLGTTYTFTFTYDGVPYTLTLTAEKATN